NEEGQVARLMVRSMLEDSDAHRRGLDPGDELISFAGRPMTSVNQFKNIVGIFPKGWRMPMSFRHNNDKKEALVRLRGYLALEVNDQGKPKEAQPAPQPKPRDPKDPKKPVEKPKDSPAAKLYEPKPGFANYYFNKQHRDRLMAGFKKHGDF